MKLTTAQALVRWLLAQRSETLDGREAPLFPGVFAIFGHGNVLGLGSALEEYREEIPVWRGHTEQGMALAAIGYAKATHRRQVGVVTSSIGPGALNMVTAAGVAHANRLPVLHRPLRPRPDRRSVTEAAGVLRASRRPLLVLGGGVRYSGAGRRALDFAERHGIPVTETTAGRTLAPHTHPLYAGPLGITGS